MSNSRYAFAYIDYHETSQQLHLQEDEYEKMRSLFHALSPIVESRPGQIDNPTFSLTYQGGMDPTQLDVRVVGDKLEFSLGNFIHVGGNSKKFSALLPDPSQMGL